MGFGFVAGSVAWCHLHSTLVRFYDGNLLFTRISAYDLHSTLVRFYEGSGTGRNRTNIHLHSTLVRFYGSRIYELAICNEIYIPHWLDSMFLFQVLTVCLCRIYIPHWLDSMGILQLLQMTRLPIYIPHWLDSMFYNSCSRLTSFSSFTFHTG